MICRFCHFDFATAPALDLVVTHCSEHDCEVCPKCYACQKAGPMFLSLAGAALRAKYAEET